MRRCARASQLGQATAAWVISSRGIIRNAQKQEGSVWEECPTDQVIRGDSKAQAGKERLPCQPALYENGHGSFDETHNSSCVVNTKYDRWKD